MNPPSEGASSATGRVAPLWATLVATFFGTGRLKPGPGTWGSLAHCDRLGVGEFAHPRCKSHLGHNRRRCGGYTHRNSSGYISLACFRPERSAICCH